MDLRCDYRVVAEQRFSDIPERVDREYAAEQWLMQQFLGAEQQVGWFAEIGANDPVVFSITYGFEQLGWSGMLVEPQPDLAARCRQERPASVVIEAACGSDDGPGEATLYIPEKSGHASLVGADSPVLSHRSDELRAISVQMTTLDVLFESHAPSSIDLVSIDVEGFTTQVLDGFTVARWRPRLILIEDHMFDFSIIRHPMLRKAGYRLAKRTGMNSWFVHQDELSAVPTTAAERRQLHMKLLKTPTRLLTRKIRDGMRILRRSGS